MKYLLIGLLSLTTTSVFAKLVNVPESLSNFQMKLVFTEQNWQAGNTKAEIACEFSKNLVTSTYEKETGTSTIEIKTELSGSDLDLKICSYDFKSVLMGNPAVPSSAYLEVSGSNGKSGYTLSKKFPLKSGSGSIFFQKASE
ncbi:MAG: hypothetical protein ACOYL6_16885 [Bacteriovoracaceae bacterium]